MTGILAWLLPDEAIVLVVAGIGLALVIGLRRAARALFGLLVIMLLTPFLLPLVDVAIDAMPLWFVLLAGAALCLAILRAALGIMVGRDAAAHAIGRLVAEAVLGMLRLVFLPLRLLFARRA